MCGIAGSLDTDTERARDRVTRMNLWQSHRGPDDDQVEAFGNVVLGNRRLAILGLGPDGRQPFLSQLGEVACVYNGEIYNHIAIRRESHIAIPSTCDGAILPDLWVRYGPNSVKRLHGMYGLAIADVKSGSVYLARDPFGIKPLFWRVMPDGAIVFASESRCLARLSPSVEISRAAVWSYMTFGSVGHHISPFDGVHPVLPGQVIRFDRDSSHPVTEVPAAPVFGDLSYEITDGRGVSSAEEWSSAFRRTVELHLQADVRSALLLSSGVDSSVLAKVAGESGHRLTCVTVAADGVHDESQAAAETASRYGHEHVVARGMISSDTIGQYFGAMQRPTIDGLNTFIVCSAVRSLGIKVAISGLGGDEALGGYPHFRLVRNSAYLTVLRTMDHVPHANALLLAAINYWRRSRNTGPLSFVQRSVIERGGPRDALDLSVLVHSIFSQDEVEKVAGRVPADATDYFNATAMPREPFERLVSSESEIYLKTTLLPDADAFSMAASVELRVPFVDAPTFAWAARLSGGQRSGHKELVVATVGDEYIRKLARVPKKGFGLPMMRWMRDGPLRDYVDDVHDHGAPVWDHLDRCEAFRQIEQAQASGVSDWRRVWVFACLNAWLRSVKGRADASVPKD